MYNRRDENSTTNFQGMELPTNLWPPAYCNDVLCAQGGPEITNEGKTMKIKCPQNTMHKSFSVSAHIAQEWEVDEKGEFKSVLTECLDTVHRPDSNDLYTCNECGTEAIVEE